MASTSCNGCSIREMQGAIKGDPARSSIRIPIVNRGIKLSSLIDFVEENKFWDKTTKQVVNEAKQKSVFLSPIEYFFEHEIVERRAESFSANKNSSSVFGTPDIYISHDWKSTSFGFLVASTLSFVGDIIHGHGDFNRTSCSTTNILLSDYFRQKLDKRCGIDSNTKDKRSFSGFGLERNVYVFIDTMCISHFEQNIMEELSLVASQVINAASLVLVVIEDHSLAAFQSSDKHDRLCLRSMIDIIDATKKLEILQEKQLYSEKSKKLHGSRLKMKKLAMQPWYKIIKNGLPHNFIFGRFGKNVYCEYENTINKKLIMALLDSSSKVSSNPRQDESCVYQKWINKRLSKLPNMKYYANDDDILDKICSRFIRNLASLETASDVGYL